MSRLVLVPVLFAIGCGVQSTTTIPGPKVPKPAPLTEPSAEGKAFLLPSDPGGAKGVTDVRKDAKDGDEVTVVGRVGGSTKPFTEGRASFFIVDPALEPTECECPWDYCGVDAKVLKAGRLLVKFVDAEGKALKGGAREMFGIQELTTVAVKGKVQRDDKGNVIVLATAMYIRPEQP